MSSSRFSFRCPVCRARQTLQIKCRRCKADLGLVVGAYQRIEDLLAQRDDAIKRNDKRRERQLADELITLSPRHHAS